VLTRKDFRWVAQSIREWNADPELVRFVAGVMADYLAKQNPRFNRDTFFKACGVEVVT
jgi:hypothetical protein